MPSSPKSPQRLVSESASINRGWEIPHELTNFDKLPNSAHVRLPVVAALYGGCSNSTVWRNVKLGRIPAPRKLTEHIAAWNVGELRKALAGRSS